MSDVENKVRELLLSDVAVNGRRSDLLRQEELRMLDKKLSTTAWVTRGVVVVSTVAVSVAAAMFIRATEVRTLIACAVAILLAGQASVLVKLWYWALNTRISLQKDLAEIRFLLAEQSASRSTANAEPRVGG